MSNFRYSLNSSTIKPTPILEKIRVAAEAGYEAIELWHADIDIHLEQGGTVEEIRKAVDDSGLFVPTSIMLKGWCEPDGPDADAGIKECRRRLEQAAVIGTPHAVAGPPHGPVDLDFAGERYAELLEIGREYGVKPSIEYLGIAETVCTIESAIHIMNVANDADSTVILDPFHDFRGGGGHEAIAKLTGQQVAVCHFDDAPGTPPANEQRDPHRVMPGDGIIDLNRVVSLLKQIGFNGYVSLELFREDLWERDPLAVAQEGLAAMKAICEAAE